MFPDLNGTALANGFATTIRQVTPADIVAVVNGPGIHAGQSIDCDEPRCHALASAPGFNPATALGLGHALNLGAERIARIDTAEHPVELIGHAFAALEHHPMVVLDLQFGPRTLRAGSADEYHNLHAIPSVLSWATGGRLRLSGAHGFMAWRADVLAALLPTAIKAVEQAPALRRGLDTALPILAARAGLDVGVIPIDATELRDRPATTCAVQLVDTLELIARLDSLR